MTDKDKDLLESIDQMISDAPKFGICSISFRALKLEVERLIREKDTAALELQ